MNPRGSFNRKPLTWELLRKNIGRRLRMKRLHGPGWLLGFLRAERHKYWLESDEGIRYAVATNRELETVR